MTINFLFLFSTYYSSLTSLTLTLRWVSSEHVEASNVTKQTPYVGFPQSHNALSESADVPQCHSRMPRKTKAMQSFKNFVKVTAEQQHKLSHHAHRLSSQHQSTSLKKLGIQIIWPAGWTDFEIILLLSWPPASNGKGRVEQSPPKMTLETGDWTC